MTKVAVPADFAVGLRAFVDRARRVRWLNLAVLAAVAVAAVFVGRLTAPGLPDTQGPPRITLPPHARLVRWEEYPDDHEAIWYYAVPDSSQDAVMTFFKGQMTRGNWSCSTSNFASVITRNGQSLSGSNGYVAAKNGSLDVQINTGDQGFGAFLLQHDLGEHAIAIKIDVTTTGPSSCGGS